MTEEELKACVVEDILVRNTLDGAFQHANIYQKFVVISDKQKRDFRSFLAGQLRGTLHAIAAIRKYDDDCHYETIRKFSDTVSKEFKEILAAGRLRIGVAQKLVNLYWKLSWLLKTDISKPIHCPFDSIVISALKIPGNRISWTQMDSIEDYKALIEACKQILAKPYSGKSIADWELELYYSKVNYNTDKTA